MSKRQIGVIGMAVMGRNLALNLESNGYFVSIFNRSYYKVNKIVSEHSEKKIFPYKNIKDFILSLKKPRCILLMIKSGKAIDNIIFSLIPYLDKGDILIDGGNTYYKDTIRRNKELFDKGFYFIGAGISGGEEGALNGPSIMPGGQKEAYELISPIFKKISAVVDGNPCVTYIGNDGSGHYVKMVHNGIEYGDMQLIAETYFLLKQILNFNNEQLSEIFSIWNQGELNSYLIEITVNIFSKKDSKNNYLIDLILDKADNKETGKWTSQSALDLGESLSLITESVFARYLSSLKDQRIEASKVLNGPKKKLFVGNKIEFIEKLRCALYLGKIISYAQGFSQLRIASKKNKWNLNYSEIARIFRSGCIIRSYFLEKIQDAYTKNIDIVNLLLTPYFKRISNEYQQSLRDIVSYAVKYGIPIPAFSSAISYYDSYRSEILPANLIQAQRDYFGSHTYHRIDKKGIFHTKWCK
ncbi:6-phosphogluconate dehydrogenase,decarboxylating [Serratia symbiotica]|nr:6-phosphogluconate dehydrogenase,decarboxylating [Serratia symbiotica]